MYRVLAFHHQLVTLKGFECVASCLLILGTSPWGFNIMWEIACDFGSGNTIPEKCGQFVPRKVMIIV